MLVRIAAFEFRYQIRSPLALTTMLLLFTIAFVDMSVDKMFTSGGGNVLYNAPHAIIMSHVLMSLLFLFLGAAFVSNVILRDEHTGFGPIIRSTRISKADYLFGRFIGAVAVGALIMAAVTLGSWLGTLMPFADQEMLGPNRLSGFAYGYGLVALPNALIVSAFLFGLATMTRSTGGTFVGVVGFLFLYLLTQRLMEGQEQLSSLGVLADPLGAMTYLASSRYLTAADFNAGVIPVTHLMIWSRVLWICLAVAILALTFLRFSFADHRLTRRERHALDRKTKAQAGHASLLVTSPAQGLPTPRSDVRAGIGQFLARARLEARFILLSPVFLMLLLMAAVVTSSSLVTARGFSDVPIYPLTSVAVPLLQQVFNTVLVVIATYYGGELVWRDRECRTHEIVDATPLPAWALMLPKVLGLVLVLFTTLLIGMASAVVAQALSGAVDVELSKFFRWYLLPGAVDATLIAALSVFVQTLSPSKNVGWGLMALYIMLLIFGPTMGLIYPLYIFGSVPAGDLFDMAGMGNFAASAWWIRLFWIAVALVMLVAAQFIWPRGAETNLLQRMWHIPERIGRGSGSVAAIALILLLLSGSWVVYNTRFLNSFEDIDDAKLAMAAYEKRFFKFASLPQPTVRHVQLTVALYPSEKRAEVSGRYRLVNETSKTLSQVHLRLLSPNLSFVAVDLPGARLERDDKQFSYRIYRLNEAMRPGETRWLTFRTRRSERGFRAGGIEDRIVANGTNLSSLELTPRIGMNDIGLLDVPAERRKYGLPERQPLPGLDDPVAHHLPPNGDVSWTTSDITISTVADQIPIAPGKQIGERVAGGRRVARFVSTTPVSNFFLFQSGRYSIRKRTVGGIEYAVYYHPGHPWNVDRMLNAMEAAIGYYQQSFGPYQFKQMRIVERPLGGGGQAFPNTVAIGESIFVMDMRDPETLDMVTLLAAHETSHQWWGHQIKAARMQGASLVGESLAQYSSLMVLKHLKGKASLRKSLAFQLDRYLSGRRTAVLEERPLISAGLDDDHINYGKGALAFYLLQERLGEAAVNRALRRFLADFRRAESQYPRSVDLISYLRKEASTPDQQQLITDLFERITFYDLRIDKLEVRERPDGRWSVALAVTANKTYANGRGNEHPASLDEPIDIALFADDPGASSPDHGAAIHIERRSVRSGSQVLNLVTRRRPTFGAVDHLGIYIDRNRSDNVMAATYP